MTWTTPKTDFAIQDGLTYSQMNAIGANLVELNEQALPMGTATWDSTNKILSVTCDRPISAVTNGVTFNFISPATIRNSTVSLIVDGKITATLLNTNGSLPNLMANSVYTVAYNAVSNKYFMEECGVMSTDLAYIPRWGVATVAANTTGNMLLNVTTDRVDAIYTDGTTLIVKCPANALGPTWINLNGLGNKQVKTIVTNNTKWIIDRTYVVVYSSTNNCWYQMLNPDLAEQEARIDATLEPTTGWVNADVGHKLSYWKDSMGMVHLDGRITNGTGALITTLPEGYRPKIHTYRMAFTHSSSTNQGVVLCSIGTNGAVNITFSFMSTLTLDFVFPTHA